MRVKGACLSVATFLATPYAWDYDLVSLTFAVVWLIVEVREKTFAPYEKIAMGMAIAMPLLTIPLLETIQVQPGFIMLWPLLLITARRALKSDHQAEDH